VGGKVEALKERQVEELGELIEDIAHWVLEYHAEEPPEIAVRRAFAEEEDSISPELRELLRGREEEVVGAIVEYVSELRRLAEGVVREALREIEDFLRWVTPLAPLCEDEEDIPWVEEAHPMLYVEEFRDKYRDFVRRRARELAARILSA